MNQGPQFRWRRTLRQLLWFVGIGVALVAALYVLIRIGYALRWTGFGQSKVAQDVQPAKTLWDWLDLLIVPIVLAIGGYLFTLSESRATQAAAERRAEDEALQAYLDQMGQMLLDKERPLRQSTVGDVERTLARAWTLTVLEVLDASRRSRVVRFLYEALLIGYRPRIGEREVRVVSLEYANLSGCALRWHRLPGIDLSKANLSNADLRNANLNNAVLRGVHLPGTKLSGTYLQKANLTEAIGLTEEQLVQAKSLDSATMPDGRVLKGDKTPHGPTFEEWRKSREGQG